MNNNKKKFMSKITALLLVCVMCLGTSFNVLAANNQINQANKYFNEVSQEQVEFFLTESRNNFANMSAKAQKLYLDIISKYPDALEYHRTCIDPDKSLEKKVRTKRSIDIPAEYYPSVTEAIEIMVNRLSFLRMPSSVFNAITAWLASCGAALADGPLPFGDIVMLGSGVTLAFLTWWNWDEIKGYYPKIKEIILDGFQEVSSSVANTMTSAFNQLFSKAQSKKKSDDKDTNGKFKINKKKVEKEIKKRWKGKLGDKIYERFRQALKKGRCSSEGEEGIKPVSRAKNKKYQWELKVLGREGSTKIGDWRIFGYESGGEIIFDRLGTHADLKNNLIP